MTMLINPFLASTDADAEAWFAAMTTQPDATRKGLLTALVTGLKADGVWALLDGLFILAAHDAQAARVNGRKPTIVATTIGSPFFQANRGYTGGGTTGLNLGFSWATSGSVFTRDAAHISAWVNGAVDDPENPNDTNNDTAVIGKLGTGLAILPQSTDVQFRARVNMAASVEFAQSASRLGHFIASRTSSNTIRATRNGAFVGSSFANSETLTAGNYTLLQTNGGNYSTDTVASATIGGPLSDAQATALHNRLNTYLTAVGGT